MVCPNICSMEITIPSFLQTRIPPPVASQSEPSDAGRMSLMELWGGRCTLRNKTPPFRGILEEIQTPAGTQPEIAVLPESNHFNLTCRRLQEAKHRPLVVMSHAIVSRLKRKQRRAIVRNACTTGFIACLSCASNRVSTVLPFPYAA